MRSHESPLRVYLEECRLCSNVDRSMARTWCIEDDGYN